MAKVYSKVNWGTNTQVAHQSLDKMDIGIDAIDTKTQNLPDNGVLRTVTTVPEIAMGTGVNSGSLKIVRDPSLRLCYVFGNIIATTSISTGSMLFNAPSGYKPTYTQTYWIKNLNTDTNYKITINPSGIAYIDTPLASGQTITVSGLVYDLS